MNKRKLLTVTAALALIGVVGIGATLAYFTDEADAKNTITMGHVDIDIDEPNFPEDKKIENVVPGDVITKDPTITVADDSKSAYIRAKVVLDDELSDAQKSALLQNINIDTTKWYLNTDDGYYYYNAIVSAGDSVKLFDTVVIPETWGNEVADMSFTIDVFAEAIQSDNFTPTVDSVTGMITKWTDKNNNPITAETYVAPSISGE